MSQKYRQRGYMEGDRDDDRSSPPRREREPRPSARYLSPEEKARRRGVRHAVDRGANEVLRCHVCGRSVEAQGAIGPETTCPGCNASLHCCRTCRQFDSGARWECRSDIDERVADKAQANRCTHYEPRLVLDATGRRSAGTPGGPGRRGNPNDPKSAFENLFKR